MDGKTNHSSQPGQARPADNLDTQLAAIMVNIGRIVNARKAYPDRADTVITNSTKKIRQSTESFHMTLDDMENELTRAKAVLLRDLQAIRDKKQAAPLVQSQPTAPMMIDLEATKLSQPSAPMAPMMAVTGPSFPNRPAPPKPENNPVAPVAPFPDMGMGMGTPQPKPAAPAPFGRAKPPVPSPKQPTPKTTPKPAPKSNPPSGRLANKPSPIKNFPKNVIKPPSTAPPSASAVAPAPSAPAAPVAPVAPPAAPAAPAPPAPPAPVASMTVPIVQPAPNMSGNPPPQSTFTNATFTLDPSNNDLSMQPSGGYEISLDTPIPDTDSFGNNGASGSGPAETANMDMPSNQSNNNNDTTTTNNNSSTINDSGITDLDHFFDMGGDSNTSFDENFNNIDDYINNDFTFDTFQ